MENDDFLDTVETTGRINPGGGSIEGIIGERNPDGTPESDWFAFDADDDQIFQFMVDNGAVTLSVYDANGNFVLSAPFGPSEEQTTDDLFFNASEAGRYFLTVTPINPRDGDPFTGAYSVSSVERFDDFGDDIATAQTITADGTTINGRIDARGDFDFCGRCHGGRNPDLRFSWH